MSLLLSKSKIKTYQFCPYRFKLQYIDNIPTTYSSPGLEHGKQFHEVMEKELNGLKDDDEKEPEVDFAYQIYKKFKPLWKEKYIKDDEFQIHGYIDRVFEIPEPGIYFDIPVKEKPAYCVVEFKTGETVEKYLSDVRFELTFYALLVNRNTDIHVDYMLGIFPTIEKIYFSRITTQNWNRVLRTIKKIKEQINQEAYDKRITIKCGWCPYEEKCIEEELFNEEEAYLRQL